MRRSVSMAQAPGPTRGKVTDSREYSRTCHCNKRSARLIEAQGLFEGPSNRAHARNRGLRQERRTPDGQRDDELRAAAFGVTVGDFATMLDDDPLHDGQAEARAFGFRRGVRLEQALAHFGRKARA